MRYACICLILSATDQAKALRELTQHVRKTTSEFSEQDVGETTINHQTQGGTHMKGVGMLIENFEGNP